jgi:non-ribosomal peptide synthetase-like protein
MENDTQLGHVSSLQSHQKTTAGKRYHGSPAVETKANYNHIEQKRCSTLRRYTYSIIQLGLLTLTIPTFFIIIYILFSSNFKSLSEYFAQGGILPLVDKIRIAIVQYSASIDHSYVVGVLIVISFLLFLFALIISLIGMAILPRLLNLLIAKEKTYVLYGFHYYVFSLIKIISNSYFFYLLFGDSSYILGYLNLIGCKVSKVEQTGSNFGTTQKHDYPFLCEVDKKTMIFDGLSMINAEISNSSLRLSRVSICNNNFFGNNIHYPHNGKIGANCLVATKAMIPINGAKRENIGILGSPCFEIPRAVERDRKFDRYKEPSFKKVRIRKKIHLISTQWQYFIFLDGSLDC